MQTKIFINNKVVKCDCSSKFQLKLKLKSKKLLDEKMPWPMNNWKLYPLKGLADRRTFRHVIMH